MENILDITNMAFQGNALERLSSALQETLNATKRGIETAVPASVAGLAAQASSTQGAAALLGAFRGGDYPHVSASEVSGMVDDPAATARIAESGHGFLSNMFGSKLGGIVDALAGQSGVSRASASTLLGLAAPLVLAAVGKEAEERHLDAPGLSLFMKEQGRKATSVLPGSMSSVLGVATLGGGAPIVGPSGAVASAEKAARRVSADASVHRVRYTGGSAGDGVGKVANRIGRSAPEVGHVARGSGRATGWLLVGLLAVGALGMMLLRSHGAETFRAPPAPLSAPDMPKVPDFTRSKITAPTVPAVPRGSPPEEPNAATGDLDETGAALSPSSGAAPLAAALSGTGALPKQFVMRGIEFQSGATEVPHLAMLDEIAETLKSHPNARIRLEAHTDATGNPIADQQLSTARAAALEKYFVARGVAANRIEAVGLASEGPVATGDLHEAHAQNRRVNLVLLSR